MITKLALNIKLHINQQTISDSKATYKVVKAGKRFGKSRWAVYELLKFALENPKKRCWYVAPTYKQAKDIAWALIKELLPRDKIERQLEQDLYIELVNGSIIVLKGAENRDSLRGIGIDFLIMDEAAYIEEDCWTRILRGQLLQSEGNAQGRAYFISSPKDPLTCHIKDWYPAFHEQAKLRMDKGDTRWASFSFTIMDNPTLNKEEVEQMRADTSDDVWNLEYMAIESAMSGTMYSEFEYSKHVKEIDPKGMKLVRGVDWGIAHPTVCLWVYVDKENKKVYVENEFKRSDLLIHESCNVITEITNRRPVEWTVIDPSTNKRNSQTMFTDKQEFARCGISCIDGDNRDRGVNNVKMFFKKNIISIHPRCKNLIYELRNLQYGDKVADDMTDTLRYVLLRIHDSMEGMNIFDDEKVDYKKLPVGQISFKDERLFPKTEEQHFDSWSYQEVI